MTKQCAFEKVDDDLLQVRTVLGVNDIKLQERLLTILDISLDKIIDHCKVFVPG